jgi:peptidoglycan hydrolase-like protein with peptidoglycan-binding domain
LRADSKDAAGSKKFHLMLLTGREARCVAELSDASGLKRLRFGSSGAAVKTLQEALAKTGHYKATIDSDMGPSTVKALIDWQRAQNPSKPAADGIFSATHAGSLGVTFALDVEMSDDLATALDDKANTKFINCPVINPHLTGNNVALRWNRTPAKGELVDTVVHIHGFRETTNSLPISMVLSRSGVSFDPLKGKSPPPARSRPTLAVVPRGRQTGAVVGEVGSQMDVYDFPELKKEKTLETLVDCGMAWFEKNQLAGDVLSRSRRLIMTAHSGGGAQLDAIIAGGKRDPSEIHLFDALYSRVTKVRDWALAHIDDDFEMLGKEKQDRWAPCMVLFGHALRVVFNPNHSHESDSCWLAREIETKLKALSTANPGDKRPEFLRRYYRVERTSIKHYGIPTTYSPWLLADAGVTLDPPVTHVDLAYCDAYDAQVAREREEAAKKAKAKAKAKGQSISLSADRPFPSIW